MCVNFPHFLILHACYLAAHPSHYKDVWQAAAYILLPFVGVMF